MYAGNIQSSQNCGMAVNITPASRAAVSASQYFYVSNETLSPLTSCSASQQTDRSFETTLSSIIICYVKCCTLGTNTCVSLAT